MESKTNRLTVRKGGGDHIEGASKRGSTFALFNRGIEGKQLELIVNILTKSQEQRSQYDLKTLVPLMENIRFFKERKIKTKELFEICNGLEYFKSPENSYVIKYGEEGDKFYIILQGQVSVWVPVQNAKMSKIIKKIYSKIKQGNEILQRTHNSKARTMRNVLEKEKGNAK